MNAPQYRLLPPSRPRPTPHAGRPKERTDKASLLLRLAIGLVVGGAWINALLILFG
jgi:hypothetical protein